MTEEDATPLEQASTLSRDAGITAAVAGLFFLLRILAVSRWNWDTAAMVAETVGFGDAATILLGTVFAKPMFTGVLIVALTPIIVVALIWPPSRNRRTPVITALTLIALIAVAGSLTISHGEWWIILGALFGTAALALIRVRWIQGRTHRATLRLLRSLGILGVLAALIMATAISTPWVALERIHTDDRIVEGYVLETPSGFLKVLTDEPRQVITLVSSAVTSREPIF